MKKPEEIKKGLECCTVPLCTECPYDSEASCVVKNEDALALIQQLEAKVPRWISVKDDMPTGEDPVLILVKETEHYGLKKENRKVYYCQYMLNCSLRTCDVNTLRGVRQRRAKNTLKAAASIKRRANRMHKCDTCKWVRSYTDELFQTRPICLKASTIAAGIRAYNAKECPFVKKEVKKDAQETTL